jgi:tRNA(Ile)-lysidine synthase
MSARADLLSRVRRACLAHELLPPAGRLLVAWSGGADSTALLDLMRRLAPELGLALGAVHVDHRQRTGSAALGRRLRRLAAGWRVPCQVLRLPVATCPPGSSETRLREARLRRLASAARRLGQARVALAHTADDQVETMLLRLARGTGLAGLAGIAPRGLAPFVHPLLEVSRREVLAYLRWRQLGWEEDPANRESRHARNRVRHELLPWLRERLNPSVDLALLRLGRAAARDEACLAALVAQIPLETRSDRARIEAARLRALPAALQARLLVRMLQLVSGPEHRLAADKLEAALAQLARPSGRWRLDLGGGLRLVREAGAILLGADFTP